MTVDEQRELEARERMEVPAGEVGDRITAVQERARAGRPEGKGADPAQDRLVAAAGRQLAARQWWEGYLQKGREADVAWRRERAAAEEEAAR